MVHFSSNGDQLFYSFPIQVEEKEKLDAFLNLLESSGVWKYLSLPENSLPETGRPSYNPFKLFAAILLGFSIGQASLREIESSCKNDLRFLYFLDFSSPSFSTISRFILDVIGPRMTEIYACITLALFHKCGIQMDTVFLDGTKQEAKPNKYKFVWKPTYFHERLSDKIRNLLSLMGLTNNLPTQGIIPTTMIIQKYREAQNVPVDQIAGGEKARCKMLKSLEGYLLKATEYDEKEAICGPHRRSYYKTDHDATAMCLKQDYYSGLGSNMHAAYSAQILVSRGFVVSYMVSQDRTDLYTLIPALNIFRDMYNCYPDRLGADAGYGCLTNYEFCEQNNIKAFVKYQSWNGESSGRNPALYELLDDGNILCLGGRIGFKTEITNRHPKNPGAVFYKVKGCLGCEFMPYCRRYMKEKEGNEKYFEIQPRFARLKQKARDLLLTPEGIEMRVNRSCQVEGVFGVIKQNMTYTRFRRTTLRRVSIEFALTCLGHNIRKFMRYTATGKLPLYWTAPTDLKAGVFKKPSAKRLARRVNKKRIRQANEIARSSYKRSRGR